MDQGLISFTELPFGEYKTDKSVSDDYYDVRNSIYNPAAALERKIEIIAVSSRTDSSELSLDEEEKEK